MRYGGKVDNGTWSLITTLSNTSNTYTHDNLSNDSEYCLFYQSD